MVLADIQLRIALDVELHVLAAGALPDRVIVDFNSQRNVPRVRKLRPGRDPHLTTTIDLSTLNGDVVAVLNEDSVVAIVGEIDVLDHSAARLGNAEDATSATTRDDFVDVDVRRVRAVSVAAVLVREAQSSIASTSSNVGAIDKTDFGVSSVLDEQAAFTDVFCDDGGDGQAVDVPGFDGVRASASDVNGAHDHVRVRLSIAVEADTQTVGQFQVDGTKGEVLDSRELQAKVWRAGHGEVRNLHAGLVDGADSSTATVEANVNGAAHFEGLAIVEADRACTDGAGGQHGESLARRYSCETGVDGLEVVVSRVQLLRALDSSVCSSFAVDDSVRAA